MLGLKCTKNSEELTQNKSRSDGLHGAHWRVISQSEGLT